MSTAANTAASTTIKTPRAKTPYASRTRWDLTALAALVAFIMFFPILWMILTGFKSEQDAISIPPKLFFTPTLESLNEALIRSNYGRHMLNSIISAIGSTISKPKCICQSFQSANGSA